MEKVLVEKAAAGEVYLAATAWRLKTGIGVFITCIKTESKKRVNHLCEMKCFHALYLFAVGQARQAFAGVVARQSGIRARHRPPNPQWNEMTQFATQFERRIFRYR